MLTCKNIYYAFQDRALFQFSYTPCVDIHLEKKSCFNENNEKNTYITLLSD